MTERPRRGNAGRLMQQELADYGSSEDEETEEPLLFDPGPEIDPIERELLSESEDEQSDEPIPTFENNPMEENEQPEWISNGNQMDIDYFGNGIYGDELPHENERLFVSFEIPNTEVPVVEVPVVEVPGVEVPVSNTGRSRETNNSIVHDEENNPFNLSKDNTALIIVEKTYFFDKIKICHFYSIIKCIFCSEEVNTKSARMYQTGKIVSDRPTGGLLSHPSLQIPILHHPYILFPTELHLKNVHYLYSACLNSTNRQEGLILGAPKLIGA